VIDPSLEEIVAGFRLFQVVVSSPDCDKLKYFLKSSVTNGYIVPIRTLEEILAIVKLHAIADGILHELEDDEQRGMLDLTSLVENELAIPLARSFESVDAFAILRESILVAVNDDQSSGINRCSWRITFNVRGISNDGLRQPRNKKAGAKASATGAQTHHARG